MNGNEYQKLAMRTLNPSLNKKEVMINAVMGLFGESGEVAPFGIAMLVAALSNCIPIGILSILVTVFLIVVV